MIPSKKKWASLLGLALIAAYAPLADAALYVVQPASGHPLDNLARSNFDIFDQKVTNHSSTARVWVTHFQRPNGSQIPGVTGSIRALPHATGSGQSRLCRFSPGGSWTGCTSWTTGYTTNLSLGAGDSAHLQTSLRNGESLHFVMFEY